MPPRSRAASAGPRRTLVVLPTYDERDTIDWVLARLLDLPEHVDVLVVDDCSPDGTGSSFERVAADEPRVRLLERPKSGLASAYLDGFRVGWPRATTSWSRWTPTSPTTPRSFPAS